jgi:hypothetical protein
MTLYNHRRSGRRFHQTHMRAVRLPILIVRLTASLISMLAIPLTASSHNGELDSFGCHYGIERNDYHCHEGVFKGGRFDSKIQMIHRLKAQFLDLGRPWPYGEITEEDITSPHPEKN